MTLVDEKWYRHDRPISARGLALVSAGSRINSQVALVEQFVEMASHERPVRHLVALRSCVWFDAASRTGIVRSPGNCTSSAMCIGQDDLEPPLTEA